MKYIYTNQWYSFLILLGRICFQTPCKWGCTFLLWIKPFYHRGASPNNIEEINRDYVREHGTGLASYSGSGGAGLSWSEQLSIHTIIAKGKRRSCRLQEFSRQLIIPGRAGVKAEFITYDLEIMARSSVVMFRPLLTQSKICTMVACYLSSGARKRTKTRCA